MYLLITNYGWGERRIDRADTLEALMTLYRDSSSPPGDLIVAKELTLTFIEPADPAALEDTACNYDPIKLTQ